MLLLTLKMANLLFVLLASTLQQAIATNTTFPATVSLWLPWLPAALHQNLDASALGVQSHTTTYALSCPTAVNNSKRADTPEPACIINGPLPQTVTAGLNTVIMTRSANGSFQSWGCHHGGTANATCSVHSTWQSIALAGHTQGKGQKLSVKSYSANKIESRPVTVTAGCLTEESKASQSTPIASVSSMSATPGVMTPILVPLTSNQGVGTSTTIGTPMMVGPSSTDTSTTPASASKTSTTSSLVMATANAALPSQLGSQGSWFALGVGILGLVI